MESSRQYHERRFEALKNERTIWEDVWRDIDRYLVPGYVRLNPSTEHHDKSVRRRLDIIDNRGQKAHRIFRSGMQSGMTSKARPWFRLSTQDMELREQGGVKQYLDTVTMRMREVMNKSNVYDSFHTMYGALGAVGTSVNYISPDPDRIVRCNSLICGHYWIATDYRGQVDTLYHTIPMTAAQIVGRFDQPGDNIPMVVKNAYDQGNKDLTYLVYHAMEPRKQRDRDSARREHMPWLSNYWMAEDNSDGLLRESGSSINRVVAARWDIVGDDVYGYSPGMDALCDVKQLQQEQSRKLQILDKTTNPPMTAPTAMKGKRHSQLPGSITFSDAAHQSGGYRPAIDLSNYNLTALLGDIADLRRSIDETFYTDIFMAITNMPGVQPRNEFEIAERKEERLLQLGPALDRIQTESLQPMIGVIHHYMREADILPDLPEELQENEGEIVVDYVSIMAQAQKAVGVGSIERLAGYIGNWAATRPEALDKFNVDQSIDEYADRIGVPTSIVVPDAEVKEIRAQRAQAQQRQEAMDAASQMAPALKQGADAASVLADVDNTQGDPTRLLDELGLAGNGGLL